MSGVSSTTASGSASDYPAFVDPSQSLLAQLAANRQSDMALLQSTLKGRESAIADLYSKAGAPLEANYNQAIKESSAVNDAVANQLKAAGTSGVADLNSKLSLINAPGAAVAGANSDVSNYYSGLGGANYAMDAGDVQRLIGRKAEELTNLQKQPGIINQQLESQYAQELTDLMRQYRDQEFGLQQSSIGSKAEYDMQKFQYEAGKKSDAEQLYWDNYWKQRDEAEQRWEVQQSLGQKKAAAATQAAIKKLDDQAKVDVANIRAGATVASAETRAGATVTAAQIAANAKGKPGQVTNAQINSAKKSALAAVMRPDGQLRWNVRYGDTVVIAKINAAIKAQGINPNSPQGKAIRSYVLSTISGRTIINLVKKNGKWVPAKGAGKTYVAPKH